MSLRPGRGLSVVTWVCVLAVLVAVAWPVTMGLPLAVLPDGPQIAQPAPLLLATLPADRLTANRLVRSAVPARAPPLA